MDQSICQIFLSFKWPILTTLFSLFQVWFFYFVKQVWCTEWIIQYFGYKPQSVYQIWKFSTSNFVQFSNPHIWKQIYDLMVPVSSMEVVTGWQHILSLYLSGDFDVILNEYIARPLGLDRSESDALFEMISSIFIYVTLNFAKAHRTLSSIVVVIDFIAPYTPSQLQPFFLTTKNVINTGLGIGNAARFVGTISRSYVGVLTLIKLQICPWKIKIIMGAMVVWAIYANLICGYLLSE